MELLEAIETRRSIRAFKSTPVPRETLKRILETARKSPSYTNTQPWEVAVVGGKKRDELSRILCEIAKSDIVPNPDIPLAATWPPELEKRSREHGARRLKALGVAREDAQEREKLRLMNFQFYGAPCVLFLFLERALTSWSIFDMGLFAQSLILAAHSFGLGSCLQAMLASHPEAVRGFLNIPRTKMLLLGISMGYPDDKAKINSYHSSRIDLDDFVRWYV